MCGCVGGCGCVSACARVLLSIVIGPPKDVGGYGIHNIVFILVFFFLVCLFIHICLLCFVLKIGTNVTRMT